MLLALSLTTPILQAEEPIPAERLPLTFDRTALAKITKDGQGNPQVSMIFRELETETRSRTVQTLGGETVQQSYAVTVLTKKTRRADYKIDALQVCDVTGQLLSADKLIERLQSPLSVFVFYKYLFEGRDLTFPLEVPQHYRSLLNPNTLIVFVPPHGLPGR